MPWRCDDLARVASLSCCAHYCVMAAPVGLRSMGSGFCDSAALGGRPLPLSLLVRLGHCRYVCSMPFYGSPCTMPSMWEHTVSPLHASVAGWDRSSCVPCLESLQVCLMPLPGAWPWWPCPARLHGGALLGTPVPLCCLAVYAISFFRGGDATLSGASVVGTAYSRLPRA